MGAYIKDWECCGDTTHTQSWEPSECPFCNRLTDREKACVNLLSAHPDLTRVTVVGEGDLRKIRRALTWAYEHAKSVDLEAHIEVITEALALLPSATVKE